MAMRSEREHTNLFRHMHKPNRGEEEEEEEEATCERAV